MDRWTKEGRKEGQEQEKKKRRKEGRNKPILILLV